ncbi:hypothetical protein Tco_1268003, partial [Tanacetum coccineum]
MKQQKVKPTVRLESLFGKDYVLWLFTFNVSNHHDKCVIILQMDGLAWTGASKGVLKRYHLQYSSTSWIGEPGGHGGQGIGKPGGQGTRGPVGLSTRGPGGLSSHNLQKSFTRIDTSRTQPIQKGQSYNWLQNEENTNSFSCQSPVTVINHGEEDDQEDAHEIDDAQTKTDMSDDELEENIGSTSHGKTITRKETRALGKTRKSCLNKKNLAFEVNDCSGRIVGDDSQCFITKGGCVMRKFAKLDGTTWTNQPDLLKRDIITKSVGNSNYDETCDNMEHAMLKQQASQHKNKQYKLHLHFKKYPTKEAAMMHPPDGVRTRDWVNLCDRKEPEDILKRSEASIAGRRLRSSLVIFS